jgi:hypothetical protein
MKKAGGFLAAGIALIAPAVWGMDVVVTAPGQTATDAVADPFTETDTLIASFRLHDIFDKGSSLGDGIPATLILVVDVWRERAGWWDALIRSQVFTYRFRRDIWSGEYEFWNLDRSVSTLPDRATLLGYLERVHEVVLGLPADFEAGRRYYVTVKAMSKPMNLDDLQEVDAWLSGKVTGSSGGGGILGIPKALARVVVDVSGLGDQSTMGRSRSFVPRP